MFVYIYIYYYIFQQVKILFTNLLLKYVNNYILAIFFKIM